MPIRKAQDKGKPKRGTKGGNRGGSRTTAAKRAPTKKSSQAAGKDPKRARRAVAR